MATVDGYAQRKIRDLRRRFLRRHWWVLALFACFVVGLSIALARFENLFSRWIDPGLVTGFILGTGVATAVAMVVTLLGMDGGRSYREGLEAESWTASALNRLRKDGWFVLHDLEFEGRNVDHVLIGPRGVVAVETKLRNEEWTITGASIEDTHHRPIRWVGELVGQTARQARTLRSLLFAGGVRTDVRPVLVLWGRGITGAPTVTIDGVLVGLGKHIDDWFDQVRSIPLSDEQVRLARRAVERRKAKEGVGKPAPEPGATAPAAPSSLPAPSGSPFPEGQPEPAAVARR
jgi:hypothetical protein